MVDPGGVRWNAQRVHLIGEPPRSRARPGLGHPDAFAGHRLPDAPGTTARRSAAVAMKLFFADQIRERSRPNLFARRNALHGLYTPLSAFSVPVALDSLPGPVVPLPVDPVLATELMQRLKRQGRTRAGRLVMTRSGPPTTPSVLSPTGPSPSGGGFGSGSSSRARHWRA